MFLPSLAFAGEWIQVDGGVVEIDLRQKEFESKLWLYLNQFRKYQFQSKDKYTYQYQVQSKDVLYINAFCKDFPNKDLNKEFLQVFDGGACFFQIKYNLKNDKFYELIVNGEA